MIPSLSQVYPVELDYERGVELLSAPSSRADSPFSAFSPSQHPAHDQENYIQDDRLTFSPPFVLSPQVAVALSPTLSHAMSELDFMSDIEEQNVMSPRSTTSEAFDDDEAASEASYSSWASAEMRR